MMDQVPESGGNEPDKADMEDIMNQYQGALLRYAARVLNNEEAAQDVVQDAFIRLHGNYDRILRRGVPIRGWLFRTTHNAAVDYIRKESRRRLLHERQSNEMDPSTEDGDARREYEDRHALVMQHLNILKPREREVLVLRMQEEMSYRQIAEVLHRSEGYVGTLIHTATKKLTQSLRKAGVVT